jgi:hypothetical protein
MTTDLLGVLLAVPGLNHIGDCRTPEIVKNSLLVTSPFARCFPAFFEAKDRLAFSLD